LVLRRLHFLSYKADMSVTHELPRLAALIPSRFVSCLRISVEENLFYLCFLVRLYLERSHLSLLCRRLGERYIGKDLEERDRGVTDSRYTHRDSNPELPKTGVQIYR
jgi:hypothetical protein